MKRITSDQTRFTTQIRKNGASMVSWFTDIICPPTVAEFEEDKYKLWFIWHKLEAELWDCVPPLRNYHQLQN
jgi:hypothetical protein